MHFLNVNNFFMIREADKQLKREWLNVFGSLSEESKEALKLALINLRTTALNRANYCWSKHKAPMALYWKVIAVYSGHLSKSIK